MGIPALVVEPVDVVRVVRVVVRIPRVVLPGGGLLVQLPVGGVAVGGDGGAVFVGQGFHVGVGVVAVEALFRTAPVLDLRQPLAPGAVGVGLLDLTGQVVRLRNHIVGQAQVLEGCLFIRRPGLFRPAGGPIQRVVGVLGRGAGVAVVLQLLVLGDPVEAVVGDLLELHSVRRDRVQPAEGIVVVLGRGASRRRGQAGSNTRIRFYGSFMVRFIIELIVRGEQK